MSLDVDAPDPPELRPRRDVSEYEDVTVQADQDLRREELQAFLDDGAWERAFEEWAAHTDLTGAEYRIALDLGLVNDFDFFWDDFADRVGYHAPGIPEDWKARDLHPDLDSWSAVSAVNAAMTELGQAVSELLKAEYVDWDAEYEAPEDLPDFET